MRALRSPLRGGPEPRVGASRRPRRLNGPTLTAATLGAAVAFVAAASPPAGAYPLDGYERTGIRRLWAFDLVQRGELAGRQLVAGATLPLEATRLRLTSAPEFDLAADTPKDEVLQQGLESILRGRSADYAVALVDITDPAAPRYAGINEDRTYLPGSVGKTLVMTGLFRALADAFPESSRRLEVLRNTTVTADRFINTDSHTVPMVDIEARTLVNRPIAVGDTFSLFEWVDHMVSPSSNAAGATVWKQAMLLARFGAQYPPSPAQEKEFFESTAKTELRDLAVGVVTRPLEAAGLDTNSLIQGTMFTRGGESVVPGVESRASPRQLVRWMLRLERGRLVDPWSSLEMKRLLYYSKGRYRYAVSPALSSAAVYFKSGSFYRCGPEEGFTCGQYRGNLTNVMNSVAIVEAPARPEPGQTQRVYLVALMSNVLRKNSAEDHRDIATEIERLVARRNAA